MLSIFKKKALKTIDQPYQKVHVHLKIRNSKGVNVSLFSCFVLFCFFFSMFLWKNSIFYGFFFHIFEKMHFTFASVNVEGIITYSKEISIWKLYL